MDKALERAKICLIVLHLEGISVKLQSAIHQDFPRWGDDPQKLDIGYIRNLTLTGIGPIRIGEKGDRVISFENKNNSF